MASYLPGDADVPVAIRGFRLAELESVRYLHDVARREAKRQQECSSDSSHGLLSCPECERW